MKLYFMIKIVFVFNIGIDINGVPMACGYPCVSNQDKVSASQWSYAMYISRLPFI